MLPSTDQYQPEKLKTNCGEEGGNNPDYPEYEIVVPTDPVDDIFGSKDEPLEECSPIFGCDAPEECECTDDGIFCKLCPIEPSSTTAPNVPETEPENPRRTGGPVRRGPACGFRLPHGAGAVSVSDTFKIKE